MLSTAYASSILHFVDSVLVVLPLSIRMRDVEQLNSRLALLGVPIVGYVANRTALPNRGVSTVRTFDKSAKVVEKNGASSPAPARR